MTLSRHLYQNLIESWEGKKLLNISFVFFVDVFCVSSAVKY